MKKAIAVLLLLAVVSFGVYAQGKTNMDKGDFAASIGLNFGWGFGVGVEKGEREGRYGWSGGQGTDFSVDPTSGRITILLTQVEMDPTTMPLVFGFRDVGAA